MEVYRASQQVIITIHLKKAVKEPNEYTASSTDIQMRDALIPIISDYGYDSPRLSLITRCKPIRLEL
jgi:hypothetical protein